MKKIRKAISIILMMIMALSMTLTAWAAEETFTITINKDATDKAAHTYGAYQLFKGKLEVVDGKKILSDIQWGDNVASDTFITELKKIEAFKDIANDASAAVVAKAISDANYTNDSDGAKALADAFNSAVTGNPKGTATIAADGTTGTIEVNQTDAGYYLIKDTAAVSGEGAQTRYILEVISDVTVAEKANIPSVEKKVKEKNDTTGTTTEWQDAADYDVGDEIEYKLEGTLPGRFAEYKTYKVYNFIDTLSEGLTPPDPDDVKVTLDTEDGTVITDLFDVDVNGQVITVSLKSDVDLRASTDPVFTKDSKIIVTYTATLNENAKIGSEGNPNTVKLEFTNNPNGEQDGEKGTTPEDKVIVFTYEIEALKVEPDGTAIDQAAYEALEESEKSAYVKIGDKWQKTKALEGAGFTLYKKVPADTEGAVDGYIQIGEEITGVTTFEFKDTDAGEYKLVETTVPAGYNKVEDIVFTIVAKYETSSADPKLTQLTVDPATAVFKATITDGTNDGTDPITTSGILEGKVLNQSGAQLPTTGGIGTTIFYILGSILVIGAGVVLVARRRMQQ